MDIKELRREMGITQHQFAEKVGVDPITVSRWERGVAKPKGIGVIAKLERLWKLYIKNVGIDIDDNADMED